MEEKQRVYIKGNRNRGANVIKVLTDVGGINSNNLKGISEKSYYYISPSGIIMDAAYDDKAIMSFLKEFYKEIQFSRWKPEYGDNYYFINYKGMAMRNTWFNSVNEYTMYEFGNCFRTEEEAKAARDKIKEMLNNMA